MKKRNSGSKLVTGRPKLGSGERGLYRKNRARLKIKKKCYIYS